MIYKAFAELLPHTHPADNLRIIYHARQSCNQASVYIGDCQSFHAATVEGAKDAALNWLTSHEVQCSYCRTITKPGRKMTSHGICERCFPGAMERVERELQNL